MERNGGKERLGHQGSVRRKVRMRVGRVWVYIGRCIFGSGRPGPFSVGPPVDRTDCAGRPEMVRSTAQTGAVDHCSPELQ